MPPNFRGQSFLFSDSGREAVSRNDRAPTAFCKVVRIILRKHNAIHAHDSYRLLKVRLAEDTARGIGDVLTKVVNNRPL